MTDRVIEREHKIVARALMRLEIGLTQVSAIFPDLM